jgi:hypothetical protein
VTPGSPGKLRPRVVAPGRKSSRGTLEVRMHRFEVPGRPACNAAQERQLGRASEEFGRKATEQVLDARRSRGGDEHRRVGVHDGGRLRGLACIDQQCDAAHPVGLGGRRLAPQHVEEPRLMAAQLLLQGFAEQVVQPQRPSRRVEHVDEQAETLDFVEHALGVRVAGHRGATPDLELGQHARPQQEIREVRRQLLEHFRHQVVEHRALDRPQRALRRRRQRALRRIA